MTDTTAAPPPDGLGTAGRNLWASIAGQVADDGFELDAREHRILTDAARTADDLALIETALDGAPVTVTGSTGQPVVNRLFDEARKSRQLIANLLKQLELSAPAAAHATTTTGTPSTNARAAASIRWGKGATGAGGA